MPLRHHADFSLLSSLYTDSARSVAVSADGDVIGGVADQSGNAVHLSQPTAAAKPIYKTGILNGKSVARFDGVDDYAFGSLNPTFWTAMSLYGTFRTGASVSGTEEGVWSWAEAGFPGSGAPVVLIQIGGGFIRCYVNATFQFATAVTPNTNYQFDLRWDGTTWNFSLNRGSNQTYTGGAGNIGTSTTIYYGSGYPSAQNVDWGEFRVYDEFFSGSAHTIEQDDLYNKWLYAVETFYYLLENGVDRYLMEDNSFYLTEDAKVPITLTAQKGSFVLTGKNANLNYRRSIQAQAGSFALSGKSANLNYARSIQAQKGSFALTGKPANLNLARSIQAETGHFVLTGKDALLFVSVVNNYVLIAEKGEFALTGKPANLNYQRSILAQKGEFALAGKPANLHYQRSIQAQKGEFVVTGKDALLSLERRLFADKGEFILTGKPADLVHQIEYRLLAGKGEFTLTGKPAFLRAARRLLAGKGTFTLTAKAANLFLKSATRVQLLDSGLMLIQLFDNGTLLASVLDSGALALELVEQGNLNLSVVE